jgi:hypothetical protein
VLDRVRRNDPTLKELTIKGSREKLQMILQAFDAIATNSSLKVLSFDSYYGLLFDHEVFRRVTRALSLNMSLNEIRINTTFGQMRRFVDIVRASPNLKALTFRIHSRTSQTNLHSLTIAGHFAVLPAEGTAFAAAFQANQTIKTLMMRPHIWNGIVSFVKSTAA